MSAKKENSLQVSLGLKLKQQRELLGYSQHKLGSLIGISQTSVSDLERGNISTRYDILAIYASMKNGCYKVYDDFVAFGTSVCAECGNEFERTSSPNQQHCSKACVSKHIGKRNKRKNNDSVPLSQDLITQSENKARGKTYRLAIRILFMSLPKDEREPFIDELIDAMLEDV